MPEETPEQKLERYEAAFRRISNICQQVYQASLDDNLGLTTAAFAVGAILGEVEQALEGSQYDDKR